MGSIWTPIRKWGSEIHSWDLIHSCETHINSENLNKYKTSRYLEQFATTIHSPKRRDVYEHQKGRKDQCSHFLCLERETALDELRLTAPWSQETKRIHQQSPETMRIASSQKFLLLRSRLLLAVRPWHHPPCPRLLSPPWPDLLLPLPQCPPNSLSLRRNSTSLQHLN